MIQNFSSPNQQDKLWLILGKFKKPLNNRKSCIFSLLFFYTLGHINGLLATFLWYMKNLLHIEKCDSCIWDEPVQRPATLKIIKKECLISVCELFKFVWCLYHNIAVQSETRKIARPFSLLGYFQQFGQGPLTNIQWPWCYFLTFLALIKAQVYTNHFSWLMGNSIPKPMACLLSGNTY